MIVKMNKVSLLCMASEKDAALKELRKLGVLHVSDVNPPGGDELDAGRARLARVEQALEALRATGAEDADGGRRSGEDAEAVVEETNKLIERRKHLEEELERLRFTAEKLKPLGDFQPADIERLAEDGVNVRLYRAASKTELIAPEGALLEILSRGRANVYFAVIGLRDGGEDAPGGWEAVELPDASLSQTTKRISEKERELSSIEAGLKSLGAHGARVARFAQDVRRSVEFLTVRSGMGEDREIAYLQGFCPEPEIESVRGKAKRQGWGLLVGEPGPNDEVPTLLRHPPWLRPIKAIFDLLNVLPGYREIDISAAFLVFFSVFFAMIVGDAGYGAIFLLATIAARRMMPKARAYPFTLLGILSVCTIAWGMLTGNYFGIASAPAPLAGLSIDWLDEKINIMKLCFLVGAVHLTIAHAWNAIRIINTPRAAAQLGWILITWTMFLAANHFVTGAEFPAGPGAAMGVTGLVAIILFMTPVARLKSEFVHHAMLPLSVINNFVDVVSYVRLFAVGMATVRVAQSFNTMAMQAGAGRAWAAPVTAIILLAGHSLNILLCALGVLVHGVRLNTLEFSNHIGLEWSGRKYDPFRTEDVKLDA